jgi:hypothetical protein
MQGEEGRAAMVRTSAGVPSGILFGAGDCAASAMVGGVTAALVRLAIGPDTDMVVGMLLGMGIGMVVHVVIAVCVTPVLGMFHAMVQTGLVGMYGGMLFAMRDTMVHNPGSLGRAVVIGAGFGLVVGLGVHLYDQALAAPTAPLSE